MMYEVIKFRLEIPHQSKIIALEESQFGYYQNYERTFTKEDYFKQGPEITRNQAMNALFDELCRLVIHGWKIVAIHSRGKWNELGEFKVTDKRPDECGNCGAEIDHKANEAKRHAEQMEFYRRVMKKTMLYSGINPDSVPAYPVPIAKSIPYAKYTGDWDRPKDVIGRLESKKFWFGVVLIVTILSIMAIGVL